MREPHRVGRIETFAAAMGECDPSLERTGLGRQPCRGRGPPARRDESRLAEIAPRRRAARRGKARPPEVLAKPGALDESEVAAISGASRLRRLVDRGVRSLAAALPYVLFHHERWDGEGYPTRRSGNDIPVGQILAVADAFDAMTSVRHLLVAAERPARLGDPAARSGAERGRRRDQPKAFVAAYRRAGEILVGGAAGTEPRPRQPVRGSPRPRASSAFGGSPRR